jgi:hypothetical protein
MDVVMKLLMASFDKNQDYGSDLQRDKTELEILLKNALGYFGSDDNLAISAIELNFSCVWAEKTLTQIRKGRGRNPYFDEFEYENKTILLIEEWLARKFSSLEQRGKLNEIIIQFDFLIRLSSRFDLLQFKNKLENRLIEMLTYMSIGTLLQARNKLDVSTLQDLVVYFIDKQILEKFTENPLSVLDLMCEKSPCNLTQKIISEYWKTSTNSIIIFDANGKIQASELILKLYDKHFVQKKSVLNKHLEGEFEKEFAKFKEIITKLSTGDIEVLALNHLEESQVSPFLLYGNKIKAFNLTPELLKLLIQTRRNEFKHFEKLHNKLKAFHQYCVSFETIDAVDMRKLYSKFMTENMIHMAVLSKLCKVLPLKDLAQRQNVASNHEPQVIYFNEFSPDHIKQLDRFLNLDRRRSTLFYHYFRLSCDQTRNEHKKLPLGLVMTKVIPSAFEKWEELARKIENNTIRLDELNNLANSLFSRSNEKLVTELKYLIEYFQVSDLNRLTKQLFLFKIIGTCTEAARLIKQIHQALEMTSNFQELEMISNLNNISTWTFANLNSDIEKLLKILSKCDSSEKTACLRHFANSIELVKWLRENVRDLESLRFLVNLTSIEINRAVLAKSLLEAGTAFAPLIFELKVNSSLAEFMDLCARVWDRLENDRNIAEKLYEIQSQLATLRQIKNQGNERRAGTMNLLNLIKENSCFKISTPSGFLNHVTELISLEYKNQERCTTKLNYEKVKELQNSLILEAKNFLESNNNANQQAEDEQDELIKYFVDFVDVVHKLANVYFKLNKNGCYFFEKTIVRAKFDYQNSTQNEWLVRVEFNDNSTLDLIEPSSSIKCLREMLECMEKSLADWLSHFNEIRESHSSINLYTTDQIIYLRKLLSKMWSERNNTLVLFSFMNIFFL